MLSIDARIFHKVEEIAMSKSGGTFLAIIAHGRRRMKSVDAVAYMDLLADTLSLKLSKSAPRLDLGFFHI